MLERNFPQDPPDYYYTEEWTLPSSSSPFVEDLDEGRGGVLFEGEKAKKRRSKEEQSVADEEVEYEEGETMRLKCRVPKNMEDPSAGLKVWWHFNGSLIEEETNPRTKILMKR